MDKYICPDFSRIALITIDTQVDTLDGQPFEIPGTSAILSNMRRLLDAFRSAQLPVVHVVRLYKTDGTNVDVCRRQLVENGKRLIAPDTSGCQIAPDLFSAPGVILDCERLLAGEFQRVHPHEVVVYKPRWGAFYNTLLEEHLFKRGVNTLVFTGCNYPNCPRASIYEASERDYRIMLVVDAVSGLYERGQVEMKNIGVQLRTTDDFLHDLALHTKMSSQPT